MVTLSTWSFAIGSVRFVVNLKNSFPFLLTPLTTLPVLAKSYLQLRAAPASDGIFDKPVLFIKGALSTYITEDHQQEISRKFPQAGLKKIMHTGHWLHAEKPQTFNLRLPSYRTSL